MVRRAVAAVKVRSLFKKGPRTGLTPGALFAGPPLTAGRKRLVLTSFLCSTRGVPRFSGIPGHQSCVNLDPCGRPPELVKEFSRTPGTLR